jgi:hemerythrin-like domain-containing protein
MHKKRLIAFYGLSGRTLTDNIMNICKDVNNKNDKKLLENLQKFVKMYRYHESREDTVIFEKMKKYLSKEEYEKL